MFWKFEILIILMGSHFNFMNFLHLEISKFFTLPNFKKWNFNSSKKLHLQKSKSYFSIWKVPISGESWENMHFWPMLVKPKGVLNANIYFLFFSCLFTIFSYLFTIFKNKLRHLKRILAFPTWGQKCILSDIAFR